MDFNKNKRFMGFIGDGNQSIGIQYNDITPKDLAVKESTDDEIYKIVDVQYDCPECHRPYNFITDFETMKKDKTMRPDCVCGKPFSIMYLDTLLDSPFSKKLISEYQKWLDTSISYWETQIQMDDIPTRDKCEKLTKLINEQNLMIENGLYFILPY